MVTQRAARFRPAAWPKWIRLIASCVAVVVILVAVGVTTYRTLRPAETISRAAAPIPSPEPVQSVQYAELPSTPLIIEDRLRVYAEERRVFADTPVTASREMTPHWAYRRWPAEVVAVVTVESTGFGGLKPVVITKWSDGVVVALDAESGEVTWQSRVEPSGTETYQGRRTGSRTVYEPAGLFLTTAAVDGRQVLIVTGKDQAVAFDPWTGTQRWSQQFPLHPGCHEVDWTGETTYVVKDSCEVPATLTVYDGGTGANLGAWRPAGASAGPGRTADWFVEPTSCTLGRSGCRLFKAAPVPDVVSFTDSYRGLGTITPAYYRLGRDGSIAPEPQADKDNVFVVGDVLVEQMVTDYIWATSRSTGQRLWMSEVAGVMVAADERSVYIVNREFQLLTLNLVTGAVTGSTELRIRPEDRWLFQKAYVHGAFVAIERLGSGKESDVDERYYFSDTPVILVGV